MTDRTPYQEHAAGPEHCLSIVEPSGQLALLPELVTTPFAPKPGTLPARLLALFAEGARLTHPEFEDRTGSWRLAAVAFQLTLLGWRINVVRIPAPTPERPDRTIGRYWLASSDLENARKASLRGEGV